MLKRLPLLVAALLFTSIRGAPAEAAASAEVGMYALAFLDGVILTGARPVATELPGVQALEFRRRIIVRVGPDVGPGTEVFGWCESFRGRHPNEVAYVSCSPVTLVRDGAGKLSSIMWIGGETEPGATLPAAGSN